MKYLVLGLLFVSAYPIFSQGNNISGNIESNVQFLTPDTIIGAFAPKEKLVINSFMNVHYATQKFRAGARFESYLPAIAGYPGFYSGSGIGYRYAKYTGNDLTITLGNFYEQFGSGMILRAYEESALGLDNSFDGINVSFVPRNGIKLKALVGRQRYRFTEGKVEKSDGIVRGFDGMLNLNKLIPKLSESKLKINIGGNFVSRYQATTDTTPPNVMAYGGRFDLYYKRFTFNAEYIFKDKDPNFQNGFAYNTGHGAVVNLGYSKKGFGVILVARSMDNMIFRSDKKVLGNQLLINYIPATTNTHTYNLAGTLYPYAANAGGEVAYQLDVLYKIPKKTKLGGKYGTDLHLNVSVATDHVKHTTGINTIETGQTYKGIPFDMRDSLFNFDFNVHYSRKFSKKIKASVHYYHFVFNNKVNPISLIEKGFIKSDVGIIDFQYKINRHHSIRAELQTLITKEDRGNWSTAVLEYTISPKWFFSVQDQYNYGNPDEKLQLHYLLGAFGYIHNTARFIFSYGKQRAGIVCIGGVCRLVPATNGVTFTLTQSF